jgi:NADH:ubiquinone oxidoreductase subunit E
METTLQDIIKRHREAGGNIITLLQDTQEAFGYVPREAVEHFADELGIAPSRFYGVATFYAQFRLKPRGKHVVTACCGTACHVKGADRLLNSVMLELKLAVDQDMTADGEFTLEKVNCVGACGIAPVVIIDKRVHGKASAEKLVKEIRSVRSASHGTT